MQIVNTHNSIPFPHYQTRKLRRLVLKYKKSFTKKKPKTENAQKISPDIREKMLITAQKKIKSNIIEYFIPYIEKKAQTYAQQKGVSIQDYTQNLYLKFFENLENIVKKDHFHLTELYTPLKSTEITDEDYICTEHCSLESLTPHEELENSCGLKDITLMRRAQMIIEYIEKILTPEELHFLSLRADGNSYKSIANLTGKTERQVETILCKYRKKLNEPDNRLILDDLMFNNSYTGEELITIKKTPVSDFNPEEIWETVKKNRGRLNIKKELDTMLKTQTYWKELLYNKSTQTKIRKKAEADPDFRITLKYDKKCNKKSFIDGARKISYSLFGKNIFKFVE